MALRALVMTTQHRSEPSDQYDTVGRERRLLDIRELERALSRGHTPTFEGKFMIFAFMESNFRTFRSRFVTRPALFMATKKESIDTSLNNAGNSSATW